MAKVYSPSILVYGDGGYALVPFAAPASHTLAGTALTDAPSGVPMSDGVEPAGAAKHSERHADR